MNLRKPFSALLILSLHFSVCTGGLLSASLAFASELAPMEDSQVLLMSPAPAEVFLCQSFTPDVEYDNEDITDPDLSTGCENGEFCLQEAGTSSIKALNRDDAFAYVPPPPALSPCTHLSSTNVSTVSPVARDGPLYINAILLAHSLVKRE